MFLYIIVVYYIVQDRVRGPDLRREAGAGRGKYRPDEQETEVAAA